MLQQTQVATVVPYFARFIEAFPDVQSLAGAEESEVLRLWEGLGYYRRARSLHQAARHVLAEHAGKIPNDPELLGALPGLGRYTINAILSQAFDRRLPILEANSRRVLCRLLGIEADPRRADIDKRLWEAAAQLLPPRRGAGRLNQALMEVGALVCTPRQPDCDSCPLTDHCAAFRLGRQEEIPLRAAPPRIEEVKEVALVVRRRQDVLIVQRPAKGRWAGLWEFPHETLTGADSPVDTAQRLLAALGMVAEVGAEMLTIRHSVTRFRITLTCLEARHRRGTIRSQQYQQGLWVSPTTLAEYPFSSPQRRLARAACGENPRVE